METPPTPNLQQAALEYASRGWHVFPCRERNGQPYYSQKQNRIIMPKAKRPYIANGVNAASTDPAQIRAWWSQHPRAAIGCNCGASGLFAFDLDMKDGRNGWASFRAMQIDHSGALHSQTPSFGYHIIYSGSGKCSTNQATGVDTRGEGGYIILPPSVIYYPDGNWGEYFQCDNWTRTPGPLPAGVLEQLFPPKPNRPAPASAINPTEQTARVRRALTALSLDRAESYDDWVAVGMALQELGAAGLSLWHEFSSRSQKYAPAVLDEKWSSFRPGGGYTLGSIFFWANQDTPDYWRR